MSYPSPEDVAERLADLYEMNFGSKSRGRFKIGRGDLRLLSERTGRLEDSVVEKIIDAARKNHALVVIPLGGFFAVIEEAKVQAWRSVPAKVINSLV